MIHTLGHQEGEHYPELSVSESIEISLYPKHGKTLDELYYNADKALYRTKKNGKNQFAIDD